MAFRPRRSRGRPGQADGPRWTGPCPRPLSSAVTSTAMAMTICCRKAIRRWAIPMRRVASVSLPVARGAASPTPTARRRRPGSAGPAAISGCRTGRRASTVCTSAISITIATTTCCCSRDCPAGTRSSCCSGRGKRRPSGPWRAFRSAPAALTGVPDSRRWSSGISTAMAARRSTCNPHSPAGPVCAWALTGSPLTGRRACGARSAGA